MKTILAPIDFSSASDHVVKSAADLARVHSGRVVLLHVVQPPVITSDYGVGLENVQEIVQSTEKASQVRLKRLQARLTRRGVPCEFVQQTGAAVPIILEQARKTRADFIVMGSHGHTALYDLLVGTTTHGVLKTAPCPVLVLPRPDAASPVKKKARAR